MTQKIKDQVLLIVPHYLKRELKKVMMEICEW